jgi:hypothetical protein
MFEDHRLMENSFVMKHEEDRAHTVHACNGIAANDVAASSSTIVKAGDVASLSTCN